MNAARKTNPVRNFQLLILLNILISSSSSAQSVIEDVIYLKDGSIFRGTIVEQHPDSLIKIRIVGNNIVAIDQQELTAVEYKVKSGRDANNAQDLPRQRKETGYFNITEVGLLPGYTQYYYYSSASSLGVTLHNINGYRFNSHFLVGAGVGVDIIDLPMLQVFGDARWEILKQRATPFLYVNAGYGMTIAQAPDETYQQVDYSGGFTWGSGVGMRFNFKQEGAFLVSMGYKVDARTEHITTDWFPYDSDIKYTYNRLSIRLGLAF